MSKLTCGLGFLEGFLSPFRLFFACNLATDFLCIREARFLSRVFQWFLHSSLVVFLAFLLSITIRHTRVSILTLLLRSRRASSIFLCLARALAALSNSKRLVVFDLRKQLCYAGDRLRPYSVWCLSDGASIGKRRAGRKELEQVGG